MDPITAALNLATKALEFGMRVYDDTPKGIREGNAAAWGAFVLNIGTAIVAFQERILHADKS